MGSILSLPTHVKSQSAESRGFFRMLRFPLTGKVDGVGYD